MIFDVPYNPNLSMAVYNPPKSISSQAEKQNGNVTLPGALQL